MEPATEKKIRVAILCGGQSGERDVSLKTGSQIAKTLSNEQHYDLSLFLVWPDGHWSCESSLLCTHGSEVTPESLSKMTDVVFIALHGKFGEDGTVQKILDEAGIPYTGSSVFASALGMDKERCSDVVSKIPVPVPLFFSIRKEEVDIPRAIKKIEDSIGFPCVVKPNASGSSIGVTIVKDKNTFPVAVDTALLEDETALVQQYISGREFSCGVLGNTGWTELVALPVVEIIPKGSEFFDYDAKYTPGASKEVCPALISEQLTSTIQKFATQIHKTLGCDGLTRSDFLLDTEGKVYFLEINTIPGQTETSICPREAEAAGISFPEFLKKQITLALEKSKISERI